MDWRSGYQHVFEASAPQVGPGVSTRNVLQVAVKPERTRRGRMWRFFTSFERTFYMRRDGRKNNPYTDREKYDPGGLIKEFFTGVEDSISKLNM